LSRVFVDTSAWVALADADARRHPQAKSHYLGLLREKVRLYTSNYVLAETYTRVRYDGSHLKALRFHEMMIQAEKLGLVQVMWVDQSAHQAAWEIFEKYADQILSFTDCTSFVLAKQAQVDHVFAFDDDFRVMGLVVKP